MYSFIHSMFCVSRADGAYTLLKVKLQPMSFNFKAHLGHRHMAIDLIMGAGKPQLHTGCIHIYGAQSIPHCARRPLTLQLGSSAL